MIGAVEAHDAAHLGRPDADDLGDLGDAGLADVPFLPLHFPEQRHDGAAPAVLRITAQDLVEHVLPAGEERLYRCEFDHLSASPSTGSMEATLMTMSANSPPTQAASSACRLMRLGTRTFTR